MTQWIRAGGAAVLFVAVLLAASSGCSSSKSNKMVVKGSVTIDGKPAEGVTLSFYGPDDKAATGIVTTQADGTYEVMFKTTAGEGNYKVTANRVAGGSKFQTGEGMDEFQLKMAGGSANSLPARYNEPGTSGLSVPLQKGLNEGKNFALKSK
jgi:hypothetical protein